MNKNNVFWYLVDVCGLSVREAHKVEGQLPENFEEWDRAGAEIQLEILAREI
jgi:hypothetical protein